MSAIGVNDSLETAACADGDGKVTVTIGRLGLCTPCAGGRTIVLTVHGQPRSPQRGAYLMLRTAARITSATFRGCDTIGT